MKQYLELLSDIMENGTTKKTRAGNTLSIFNKNLSHNMCDGFPLLTSKKIDFKNIVIEMLWFLSGNSSPSFLHKHNIHFWDGWIEKDGMLPISYGENWRAYPDGDYSNFDQFKAIVDGLKKDKDNRRLVIDRWHAPTAWKEKLPPCFFASIFNVQYNKNGEPNLCLHNIGRSVDAPVGLPYNIAGFALLLCLVSHLTNIPPGTIAFSMTDAHIYENQIDGVSEQITRIPGVLPTLLISDDIKSIDDVDNLIKNGTTLEIMNKFKIIGYNPQSFIKLPVAV